MVSAGITYGTLRILPLLPMLCVKRSPSFLEEIELFVRQHATSVVFLLWVGILVDRVLVHKRQLLGRLLALRNLIKILSFLQYVLHWTLVVTIGLWLCTSLVRHHYDRHLRPLLDRYRWNATQSALGETYYHRHCTVEDLSTTNMSKLILQPHWDATMAAETLYMHGAAVFPQVVDRRVADAFRNYTLKRNRKLTKDESVYVMNTYSSRNKHRQTRWSFAFSPNMDTKDAGIVSFLHQVATSPLLVSTLEMLLGPDPAVIKMQTITAKQGAENQAWHPDVNAYGSVKSHARNFVQHWSLFVPLQDTLGDMGATGMCPGTHFCSSLDDDLIQRRPEMGGCGQVHSGFWSFNDSDAVTQTAINNNNNRDDNDNNPPPPQPVWLAGDAVLMNQNTFHRGWKYSNPHGKHRAIVVITFTSRPRYQSARPTRRSPTWTPLPSISSSSHYLRQKSDLSSTNQSSLTSSQEGMVDSAQVSSQDANRFVVPSWNDDAKLLAQEPSTETRVLGLGTPLTSFGLTLQDLRKSNNPGIRMLPKKWLPWLRFLGLYKLPNANWGWDYMTSVWSRISAETHKFQEKDLSGWIQKQKHGGVVPRFWIEFVVHERVPKQDAQRLDRGIWDVWYSKSIDKTLGLLRWISLVLGTFYILVIAGLTRNHQSSLQQKPSLSLLRRFLSHLLTLLKSLTVVTLILGCLHCKLENSSLSTGIRSGRKIRPTFPNVTSTRTTGNHPISLVPMAGVRRITHGRGEIQFASPDRYDVLCGTRLNSLYLWAVNHMLDYHTGNQKWRCLLREAVAPIVTSEGEHRPLAFQEQPKFIQDAIVESIMRKTKGKYLLQVPENGNFTLMTKQESRYFTRKAIMVGENQMLFLLDETVAYMIAEMRYESSLRTTPLCAIAIGVLEELLERFFDATGAPAFQIAKEQQQNRVLPISFVIGKQTQTNCVRTGMAKYLNPRSAYIEKAK